MALDMGRFIKHYVELMKQDNCPLSVKVTYERLTQKYCFKPYRECTYGYEEETIGSEEFESVYHETSPTIMEQP